MIPSLAKNYLAGQIIFLVERSSVPISEVQSEIVGEVSAVCGVIVRGFSASDRC